MQVKERIDEQMALDKMLQDPAIQLLKTSNKSPIKYPSPRDWVIESGAPVSKLSWKKGKNGKDYQECKETNIPRPIWVQSIIHNVATRRISLTVGFEDGRGKVKYETVDSRILNGTAASREAKSLTEIGAPVSSVNFKTVIELFLLYSKDVKGLDFKYGVDQFGWYGQGLNFILTESIGEDLELQQLQSQESLKHYQPKGEFAVWKEVFQNAILDQADGNALFACSVAMSSLLKGVLQSKFEFIPALLIYGESGRGKSTIQQLIASMIGGAGLKSKDEGIVLCFNTTLNALQSRMSALGPVPCIVDEKSLENDVQGKRIVVNDLLYTVNTGIKDRLDSSSGTLDNFKPVECSLIFSGESKEDLSGNTGKQYRLVQQRWRGFKGDPDGSLAEKIKAIISDHSGHYLPKFINYLISNYDTLEQMYQEGRAVSKSLLLKAEIPSNSMIRLLPNLSRNRLACKIIIESLAVDQATSDKCMNAFDNTVIEVYQDNIIRTEAERIPDKLKEGIASNINKFSIPSSTASKSIKPKYNNPMNGEVWGRVFTDGTVGVYGRYLTYLVEEEFSLPQIREVIKNDLDGTNKIVKINGVNSRLWCFNLDQEVI